MSCVHVGHASYGRVQTAPKVRVCAAVLRETYLLHACPRMQKFTPRNTATTTSSTRSTKTRIMTVHVNTIMQAQGRRKVICDGPAEG